MFSQQIAESVRDSAHDLTMTRNIGEYDFGDEPLATDREIVEISTFGRGSNTPARNPSDQTGQLNGIGHTLVAAPDLQAREPPEITCFEF